MSRLEGGSLASRLIVAAGGGGGGGGGDGGAGAAADAPGLGSAGGGAGGGAGTQTAGGVPNGTFGVGGAGLGSFVDDGGGGGGGGYHGGGGGAAVNVFAASAGGGGGGGGSSFFAPQVLAQGTAGGLPTEAPRVSLTYSTVNLSATTASFGVQQQGTVSAPQTVALTNSSPDALVITGLVFEGANAEDFTLGLTDCLPQIAATTTCTLRLQFAPQSIGARTGKLRVRTNLGDRTIDLSGTGGQAAVRPCGRKPPGCRTRPRRPQGRLVIVADRATVRGSRVTVRYTLTGPATVTLKVKPPKGAAATVAKGKGKAGINQISWKRKLLKGKKAPRGAYKLTITATAGGKSVSSTLSVKLK